MFGSDDDDEEDEVPLGLFIGVPPVVVSDLGQLDLHICTID
jgi:hypothetical protein